MSRLVVAYVSFREYLCLFRWDLCFLKAEKQSNSVNAFSYLLVL